MGAWMVRACSIHGRGRKMLTEFYMENLKGRDHIGNLATGGTTIDIKI
jgi:hypothetical protein